MLNFNTAIILTSSITIWYVATAKDKCRLQCIICSAEKEVGCKLPPLQHLYISKTLTSAGRILANPSHRQHKLSDTPLRQEAVSIKTKTFRLSFRDLSHKIHKCLTYKMSRDSCLSNTIHKCIQSDLYL